MNLVQNLVDEVKWRYKIGTIESINAETVEEIAEDIYPNYGTPKSEFTSNLEFGDLIFEAMMRL